MLRRLRWLVRLNQRVSSSSSSSSLKSLPHAEEFHLPPDLAMFDASQEIAVYIHKFHNLDLFQQGWYQLKITMRWEDDNIASPATPARVVQYEASDLRTDEILGIWRIDDADNSFSTQPFRIKYARQDVLLSVMISFNLSLGQLQGISNSSVIIKFELMFAPMLENRPQLLDSLDACSSAVHEFRVPPKALLGLHSYCPVHFDAFHAVLVDTSLHITLLKGGPYASSLKVPSDSYNVDDAAVGNFVESNQASHQSISVDTRQIRLVRALFAAHNTLLEELQKLSKGIGQEIDLTDSKVKLDTAKSIGSFLKADLGAADEEVSEHELGALQNGLEDEDGANDFHSDGLLLSLPKDVLMKVYHSLGSQVQDLWNIFLKFHRANKIKIMEFLRDAWASDRKAEWSIWMVHSKVEMPHHYLSSGMNDSSFHGVRGKVSTLRKLNVDPAQTAAMRAELHRRSIAQMKINNQSIQDMHIFGDPSRVPIIIVERVVNAVLRTTSGSSYFSNLDHKDTPNLFTGLGAKAVNKLSGASPQQSGRILRIVVFVHGFQGHHLDLRLVRNQWLLIDPKIEFLMSEVNEDKTSGDLRGMGLRLAQEVTSFLKKKMDKMSRSGAIKNIKLNFVGHSIGNVIIRSALSESIMEPFLRYLHTYVSISGPHLGYLYSSNVLFNSGLWLLKKLKGTRCIHQLTLTDDPDLENTFFYKLCKQKTLEGFRNVILISSPQDGYVPYHSARIDVCQASSWDSTKKGKVFLEMLNNCLDQIRAPSTEHRVFMRCDVNFETSSHGRNLNTFIGRAAHIEFLESDIFARFIMWSFPELFR